MSQRLRILTAAALFGLSAPAAAYIGPGAGVTAIGTFVALVGAVLFAVVGFIWYPLKRLRAKIRKRDNKERSAQVQNGDDGKEAANPRPD